MIVLYSVNSAKKSGMGLINFRHSIVLYYLLLLSIVDC